MTHQTQLADAARPEAARPQRRRPERLAGAMAIALAAALAAQNAIVAVTDPPTYAAPMAQVLAFHAQHRVAVAADVALEALNLPLLLGFLTGLHGLAGRRRGAGAHASRLAVAAAATFAAVTALYAAAWISVVLVAADASELSPTLDLAWRLHAAAFALSLPALGTAFMGAAWATHARRMTPRWQLWLGLAGGGLMMVAGAGGLAIADGSDLVFVGVVGFAAWFVWLLATGIRLALARPVADPGDAPLDTADHANLVAR